MFDFLQTKDQALLGIRMQNGRNAYHAVVYRGMKEGKEEFVWFVEFIRDYGFTCKFAGKQHIYFEFDGHYYWTMGEPIEETIILNRCKADDYQIKDGNMLWKEV